MHIPRIADSCADTIWDTICYHGTDGETFKTKDIERSLVAEGFKPKTAQLYFNHFVHWAIANPEQFGGPRSKITRVGYGKYRLDDNIEH